MAELKESSVFKKILMPNRIKLEISKLNDTSWTMKYTEWFDEVDQKIADEATKTTKELLEKQGLPVLVEGNMMSFSFEGPIDIIAFAGIGELMSLSKFGDMSLRDLIIFLGMALAPKPLSPVSALPVPNRDETHG